MDPLLWLAVVMFSMPKGRTPDEAEEIRSHDVGGAASASVNSPTARQSENGSPRMPRRRLSGRPSRKAVLVSYCLAAVLLCMILPWRARWGSSDLVLGYGPVWSPPDRDGRGRHAVPDFERLFAELAGLSALAGALFLIARRPDPTAAHAGP